MRALDAGLQNLVLYRHLNTHIHLSHSAYAALANAALGLDSEITPEYVKTYRARKRRASSSSK